MALSSGLAMSAIPPLSGHKQTFGERAKNDASDPDSMLAVLRFSNCPKH
jgi:hypothetical protein